MNRWHRYLLLVLGMFVTIVLFLSAESTRQHASLDQWSAADRLYVFYWLGE